MVAEWYVHQGVWVLTYNTESTVDGFVSLTRGSKSVVGGRGEGKGVTEGYDEMARRRIRRGDGEGGRGSWSEVEEERVVEQEATPSRFARAAQHNIAAT